MKSLFTLVLLFIVTNFSAQISVGQWRLHMNAANAFDSEVNKIFVKLANPPIQSLFALGNEISNSI